MQKQSQIFRNHDFNYCIGGNFDGGNFDVFDAFLSNLTYQFFKATQHLVKDSETIHQNILRQIFEKSVSVKFSPRQNFPLYGI